MPKQFGFREQMMHKISELSPVDKFLQKRAEWVIENADIEKYLKEGGSYLDMGMGKGHVVERVLSDMEKAGRSLKMYAGIDVADKPLKKVQKRELQRKDKGNVVNVKEDDPLNFSWATAESLPYGKKVFDGVSFFFYIHHMNKDRIDKTIEEAKRVIKDDGYIFIAEDLVDSEEQRRITEETDRKLNWEDVEKG